MRSSGERGGEPEVPPRPAGAPDIAPVPEADAGPDSDDAAKVEQDLDRLLNDARSERDEYLELAQRTRADFENYRRRATQEAQEAGTRGKSSLARELVPALDNLERALRAAGIDPDGDGSGASPAADPAAAGRESEDAAGVVHGVLLVYRELRATLERAGVETYDPTGERFDPSWHEALSTRAEPGTETGTVLETVEKGYRLNGQVLRPAKVVVSE